MWFRPPIEIEIVCDALNNDPDGWNLSSGSFGSLSHQKMGLEIENVTDFLFRLVEGHPVKRHDVTIRGTRRNRRIGQAIKRWKRRRDDAALRRLIDDDHTERVRRIAASRLALERDEAAHLESLIRRGERP